MAQTGGRKPNSWQTLPGAGVSGGQHQAGTCRMGNDPKTSVVDAGCQLHDVDNVYVVDGSVHVNNGGFNPSLTIQAIAYWAAEDGSRDRLTRYRAILRDSTSIT